MSFKLYLYYFIFYIYIISIYIATNLFKLYCKIKISLYIAFYLLYYNYLDKKKMNFKEPVSTFTYNLISLHHDVM